MIPRWFTKLFNSEIVPYPEGINDRYFAQDLHRDQLFLLERAGITVKDLINISTAGVLCYINGSVVEGSSKTQINIPVSIGYAGHDVTIQDETQAWAIPAASKTVELGAIRVESTQQVDFSIAGATLDGVTTNYLKMQYNETDGRTRNRAFGSGSYAFERIPGFTIYVDDVAPTTKDIPLAEIVGDGSTTLTITQYKDNKGLEADNADTVDGADLDIDTALSADSDVRIPSQKAIKAYVDSGLAIAGFTQLEATTNTTYSAFTNDISLRVNSGSAISIDVTAGNADGRMLFIQNIGAGTCTLTAVSGRTIDLLTGQSVLFAWNGTEWVKIGGSKFIEVLTSGSSATWTSPWAGSFKASAIGGGGGGGDASGPTTPGASGGGGGGGLSIKQYVMSGGQGCTYTVGAGGAHAANGGTTSFTDGTTAISATGGTKGPTINSDPGKGGAGGIGSGGDINAGGCGGGNGSVDPNSGNGGPGGSSFMGGGATGASGNNTVPGLSYGGGGGGGSSTGAGTATGSAGAGGVVVIEY